MRNRSVLIVALMCIIVAIMAALCLGEDLSRQSDSQITPRMTGPDKIDSYKLVEFKVEGVWEQGGWRIRDVTPGRSPLTADKRTIDGLSTCIFVAPPGTWDVEATLVHFGDKRFFQDAKVVTVGDSPTPVPPTPPKPPDPPVPPPGPAGKIGPGNLWLICVLPDLTRPTPGAAAVQSNQELRHLIDDNGNHFRWVDPNAPPADLEPYVRLAVAEGLPRALVASAEASDVAKAKATKDLVRESVPLTDAKAVKALVEKWSKL